jgi:hypothetical protein
LSVERLPWRLRPRRSGAIAFCGPNTLPISIGDRRGKRTEARDLLSPIYGWFTEGFDTPVLKETDLTIWRPGYEAMGSANDAGARKSEAHFAGKRTSTFLRERKLPCYRSS